MTFLNDLSLRTKLILLSLIPMAGLLYYLQLNVRQELRHRNAAERVIQDVQCIQEISSVIHELQKERALTRAVLSGSDIEIENQIVSQREDTDHAIFALDKVFNQQDRSIANYRMIDSLAWIRAKVNPSEPSEGIDVFYQRLKNNLLQGVSEILRSSENLRLKNHFEEHLFLLYAKEYLANTRTELAARLASGKFTGTAYGEFVEVKGKHEENLEKLRRIASPELKAFIDRKYTGPLVKQAYEAIESAFADPMMSKFHYDYNSWRSVATNSINVLKEVEDYSIDIINEKAYEELSRTRAQVSKNIVIAALIMLLIALVIMIMLRGILSSLRRIKYAADRMAEGDVSTVLDVKGKDEIGALAASFNKMISVTKRFSEIADTIGKGDYSPAIDVRGAADTLGIALSNMRTNLEKLSRENEIRTWLLTGNSQLNDAMRGEKDLRTLAQGVIVQLTSYLNAQVGAIYLAENNYLLLVSTYADWHRDERSKRFKVGDGLVGQAALEKKPIIFNNVPDNYIRINSGLGHVPPQSIIVYPFLFEGEVKGLVEIGSVEQFSDLHLQLFEMVSESIAIAFHAAQSRTQLKELLEETQRQAEELEAQQEELRQSNEELQVKTELLEKSEGELKAQQDELQQTNVELEEKANLLEEQRDKLELAKIEIEAKARDLELTSQYKSQFLANMSHELRTPLNSILILSQLLSENKNQVLGEKEVEFCRNIHNSGADLLNLINEILDLSKVESGRMELDIDEFALAELAPSMDSIFRQGAKNRSIDFQIKVAKELAGETMVTDKHRLEQILKNLLSNAFKFTADHGSVSLSIEMAPLDVQFRNSNLFDISQVIAFAVTDNGIGIPPHKLDVIFEAFQQADGSTKRKYGGTGLGLSISRELAQVLGGEIHVYSEETTGSKFTLYLPLRYKGTTSLPEQQMAVVDRRALPNRLERTKKVVGAIQKMPVAEGGLEDDRYHISNNDKVILILEDDREFARVLRDFIRERKYKAIVAASGNTGLSCARQYKPDAIILDMKLPVMEGSQVLRHLKNDPDLRHIPVQIISGYDYRKETLALGAFDFLPKPLSPDDLRNAFDRIEDFMSKKLKKLLVIEDDENQNAAIRELIGNGDVKSFSAFSGKEAYEMMSKVKYDCIILDLGLPDMPGLQLLEMIKRNEELNKVPIIVYTGRDITKEEHDKLIKLANTVVLKTVDSHERLLDETMLFLHRVESRLPREKQNLIRKLHKADEVLKSRKVLVVDDDIRNVYSLTNVLEEEGVQCLTAENGKVALEVLKQNPDVELVLMDVMMPEMDGYEATQAIRATREFSKLPVIALTAKAMKGDREKCLAAGMSDYISKPLNVEQLLSLMRVWLYR